MIAIILYYLKNDSNEIACSFSQKKYDAESNIEILFYIIMLLILEVNPSFNDLNSSLLSKSCSVNPFL